jgi:hypothetical protein
MKPFVELDCDNVTIISQEIYNFLKEKTTVLDELVPGWHFIDQAQLLSQSPELLKWFQQLKLLPRHSAVTVVMDDNSLPLHVDELPVVAKINIPVINTKGWTNRWIENDVLIGEVVDLPKPIVLNSQIPHSVVCTGQVNTPRIIASFTFHNEPIEMLR